MLGKLKKPAIAVAALAVAGVWFDPNGGGWSGRLLQGAEAETCKAAAATSTGVTVSGVDYSSSQISNVKTIISVGKQHDVPQRGWVVAISAASQESRIKNLDYGDRDSIGMFQQRDAWGSYAERISPEGSSKRFYTGGDAGQPGLLDHDGWEDWPIGVAAQDVQVSAYPDLYTQHVDEARALVRKYGGGGTSKDKGCG